MLRHLGKSSLLNLAVYGYLLLLSFVALPWIVNGMGVQLFAIFAVLSALPPILSTLDFGIGQALTRNLSQVNRSQTRTVITSLTYYLVNGLVSAVVAVIALQLLEQTAVFASYTISSKLVWLISLIIFFNQQSIFLQSIAQGLDNFYLYNLKPLIVGTSSTGAAGILAIYGAPLETIFAVILSSYIVTILVYFYYLRAYIILPPRLDKKILQELLTYGVKGLPGRFAGQLELHGAKLLLTSAYSAPALGAYALAQSLVYKLTGALSQINLVLFPLTSKLQSVNRRDELRKIYYTFQIAIFAMTTIFVGLIHFYGMPLLSWWLGEIAYLNLIYDNLRILSYFLVPISLTPLASAIVDGLGYPQYTSYSALANVSLYLLLLVIMLPHWGELAASYALFTASLITTPIFLLLTERLLQQNKLRY